jgi:PIN domain nuclease of toxin-antitoxin system
MEDVRKVDTSAILALINGEPGADKMRAALPAVDFSFVEALATARLCIAHPELSLGDRACIATAVGLGIPALTVDRNWRSVRSARLEFIR